MGRLVFEDELRKLDRQIVKRQHEVMYGMATIQPGEYIRWVRNDYELIGRVMVYIPDHEMYHIVIVQEGPLKGVIVGVPSNEVKPGTASPIFDYCPNCGRYET